MKDDAELMIAAKMEGSLDISDEDLCRETWNQLFLMSGGICMVAGVVFVLTSGAETIDPIVDPIAVEVARKRGWKWGSKQAAVEG